MICFFDERVRAVNECGWTSHLIEELASSFGDCLYSAWPIRLPVRQRVLLSLYLEPY